MEVLEIIKLGIGLLGWLISFVIAVFKICKNAKNKKLADLKTELTTAIIPLMEQAERAFDDGNEKENWVIKKLSEITHYDFFKHKWILTMAKEIIPNTSEISL